ncbi:MAG: BatA domain-containing protein [Bacteroidota bacterium]|nr:BatA domain-containing protein [Bacteroidota bacterium]
MNISFVYPGFLFALALISIPVIVHLFNFRKFRKVYFTNVSFLKELKEETTSRSRLKHLLVLLSRILAVIFLVLAFAQPYFPAEEGKKLAAERAVSIYIDNSFSMEAVTREGTLLDQAKTKAVEIASAFKQSDRFQLLTNDFDPVNQRLISREEFINAVSLVKVSPVSRKTKEIISRQADALNQTGSPEKSVVLISDFQESMTDQEFYRPDTSFSVTLVPLASGSVSNISVDSVWFTSPVVQLGQIAELNVRIRNFGELDGDAVPVKLLINDIQKAVAGADIPSGNYTDVKLTFTAASPGWQKAMISITDNPVTFDDQYYFSFPVAANSELLVINKETPGPYLAALFAEGGYFKINHSSVRQIDYSAFSDKNTIILDELATISSGLSAELVKYLDIGGTLVIIPDSTIDFESYRTFFQNMGIAPITSLVMNPEKVDKLMVEDPLFSGVFSNNIPSGANVDLPVVQGYYIQPGRSSGEVLMQLRSGAPLLSRFRAGKGEVYVFMVPFSGNRSNLARHALFVPTMYRIALLSEKTGKLAFSIGTDDRIELPAVTITGDNVFHLRNESMNFDVIPAHRSTGSGTVVSLNNQVVMAGIYELQSAGKVISMPSFNFNRDESVMRFRDATALNEMIEQLRLKNIAVISSTNATLTAGFTFMNEGIRLWKYCIILVLIFLAIEILLLKFWRK